MSIFWSNSPAILLLGGGAREHALAWKLSQDGARVHVAPGNAGIPGSHPELSATDFPALKSFCEQEQIRLIVVGPEAPLAAGVTNFFAGSEISVFGPTKAGAVLESSKIWSKDFMRRHGVATAQAWAFERNSLPRARAQAAALHGQVVIKYDGLAAGKGVYVCGSEAEAEAALDELQSLHEDNFSFLVEEKLTGPEISIIGLTDGRDMALLSPSQDHKQLLAGDEGPNTGGMGAYCPVPFLTAEHEAAIHCDIIAPTLQGIQRDQLDFKGFLYFGIMLTPAGPKLLEYNVRLGDPEAEVLLPALESSLLDLITATLDGTLSQQVVRPRPGAFVGVVLASGGYPAVGFPTGFPITGLENLPANVLTFHGATRHGADGQLLTSGGRVLVLAAHGSDLAAATARAYAACAQVSFQGKYVRPDIAQRPAPVFADRAVN